MTICELCGRELEIFPPGMKCRTDGPCELCKFPGEPVGEEHVVEPEDHGAEMEDDQT